MFATRPGGFFDSKHPRNRIAPASGRGRPPRVCNTRLEDGVVLSWRLTDPFTVLANGIVPFFIDWGQTPHPAQSAAQGSNLADLRAEHPGPKPVQEMLNRLALDLRVYAGSRPALIATITSPQGRVELR